MTMRFSFDGLSDNRLLRKLTGRAAYCLSALTALSVAFVSCGGDDSSLSCGEGTSQKGSVCIADMLGMAGGGNGGAGTGGRNSTGGTNGTGGSPSEAWTFDGATAVAPVNATSLLVVWGAAPGASFNIYVSKKATGFNFSSPQTTAPVGARSVQLTGLDEDTEYFVVVRAVLNGKEDDNTEVVSGTTGADTKAPTFAGATKAAPAGAAEVKLSWAAAKDNLTPAEAIQYIVYFGLAGGAVDLETPFAVSAPGAKSIVVKGLPLADTEYYFIVRALDAAGNQDDNIIEVSAESGPDTSSPQFAGCTAAQASSATAIDVFWDPATDDTVKADQITYNIYASKTPDGHNFSEIGATVTGTNKGTITGLSPDTLYYLVCRAADPSGNEDENASTRSATTKDDDQPPVFAGITGLTATTNAKGFDVTWAAASDNQTPEADIIYDVFVADASAGQVFDEEPTTSSLPGATGVTLDTLKSNTQYFVVVRARDLANNKSENTEELSGTTFVSLVKDIELPIFSSKCATSGCHTGTVGPTGGMQLDPGWSWINTVNVAAQTGLGSGKTRVVPGKPEESHLYERITLTDFNKMPPTGDPVDTEIIRLWIEQGALKN